MYARVHATVAPFAPGAGKAVPNFVLEGLAAGRPCIAIRTGGWPHLIECSGAGLVVARDVGSLSDAIDRMRDSWSECP